MPKKVVYISSSDSEESIEYVRKPKKVKKEIIREVKEVKEVKEKKPKKVKKSDDQLNDTEKAIRKLRSESMRDLQAKIKEIKGKAKNQK